MNTKEHLAELAEKMRSGCGPTVGYDEVQQWPDGRLEELIKMGVLAKGMYAKRITCTDCAKGECSGIEPTIETIQETGETAGFFLCPKWGGMKKIPTEQLQRWVIVPEKLEELGCPTQPLEKFEDEQDSSRIELDLDQFSDNRKEGYDFKQEMATLAEQGYIKYQSHDEATKAARRIRERLRNSIYASIIITQTNKTLKFGDGIKIIIKK